MTGPVRRFVPAPHWPSVAGRARADAGPLALVVTVVASVSMLASAVPPLLSDTADAAIRDSVVRAGDQASVRMRSDWGHDYGDRGVRVRQAELADDVDRLRDFSLASLPDGLEELVAPPIVSAISESFKIPEGTAPRTVQLAYLANAPEAGGGPDVTWIAGTAPAATAPGFTELPSSGPWTIQAGLTERSAAELGVRPGDHIRADDTNRNPKDILVSGIFRPVDPDDPAWRLAPAALGPIDGADGIGITRIGALLTRDSLPDARLGMEDEQLNRTVWLTPDTGRLTLAGAEALSAAVTRLKATSSTSGSLYGEAIRWESQLDSVLREGRRAVDAAVTQSSVLLLAVLTAAVLVLLLAADLLARRRGPGLATARRRGASLPDLTTELAVESVLVAALAGAAGLGLTLLFGPGVAWTWAVPVVVAAVLAGPGFGVLAAARATRNRRAPANRSARRWAARTVQIRRLTLEAAVVAAAVGAFVALRQRGIVAGDDGLPASAPALAAVAAGLLLLRLLPAVIGFVLRGALRSRRPLAVFGAARAADTSGRALPLLIMVAGTTLATFALTLGVTVDRGLDAGAWRTVGADASLTLSPAASASVPDLAARIAAAPGVRHTAVAQLLSAVRITADENALTPELLVVDSAAFRTLLADTEISGVSALDLLADATSPAVPPPGASSPSVEGAPSTVAPTPSGGPAAAIPVLVRSADGAMRTGAAMTLYREDEPALPLTAVGAAPLIGDAPALVVVDAAALADAGLPMEPNTIWATGPGAGDAVTAIGDATVPLVRTEVLAGRSDAPLTAGLRLLARASAATLLALGLLGLFLGAAAGAPDRWLTLSRLRTLGLRPRDMRWVAAGELLPPPLVAAIAGPVIGAVLALLTTESLSLRLLTAQDADPPLALPWWQIAVLAVVVIGAVAVVVPVESAVRRRRNLGEILRIGG
ncbi:FtsX-like permease family protein [Catenuloplanes japonicus]|uniref:FtsX-like permease family protein n=1 Tax=Catenuloplanes japonicus TaxID=33876 RepID=UPI000526F58C|nr:FtsX-like permease family protein [Catenuloplanes japonicus]